MRTRATTGLTASAIAGLALAGCASHPTPHVAPAAAAQSAAASPAATPSAADTAAWTPPSNINSCSIYLYGHDARIAVTTGSGNDPTPECRTLSSSLSGGGAFWTSQTITTNDPLGVVCAADHGDLIAVVRDGSSQLYGQQICANMLQAGWTEDSNAEANARQQDNAATQAQAEASTRAAAVASAQEDVARLQQANSQFSNATRVTNHLATVAGDLKQERADIANGNGDNCYNVQVTVAYDAQNNVGYEVNTSASYDVTQEQDATNSTRSFISTVQQEQAALQADGLPSTPGADDAIATSQRQTAQALATTNNAIDQMNADLATAFRIANSAGTGACAGQGPGAAPSGLSHIS